MISATRCPFLYSVSMFHTLIAEYVFSSEKKKKKKEEKKKKRLVGDYCNAT